MYSHSRLPNHNRYDSKGASKNDGNSSCDGSIHGGSSGQRSQAHHPRPWRVPRRLELVQGGVSAAISGGRAQLPRRSPGPRCVGGRWPPTVGGADVLRLLGAWLRSLPDGEKAVLVGHSFGGLSVTLAAELFPEKVAAAVFLTAFMPDCVSPPSNVVLKNVASNTYIPLDNEMKPQEGDGELPASFMFEAQYTEQKLYQLCSPEDLTLGKSLMRICSLYLEDLQIQPPFTKNHYGSVRKVYIVCKQDETIHEEIQRWMVENNPVDEVMEIDDADHMAMLSTPDQVVKCIVDIAKRYN